MLLENGGDVNKADNLGATPLYIAASSGRKKAVKLLLDSGADAAPATLRGTSPVFAASRGGHTEIIEMLLASYKGNVNEVNSRGQSPAFVAAQLGKDATLKVLCRYV